MSLNFTAGEMVEIPPIPIKTQVSLPAARSAVIVVDMQNDFVSEGGNLVVPSAAATLDAIAALLANARRNHVRIAYTQDTHYEGDPEWQIWPEHCRAGTWGWQIVEALAPHSSDLVCPKSRYDGFYDSSLDHYLSRVWKVEHLVIVGTISSICVLHTAASAGLRWFHVVTPVDGVSALNDFDQALALRQISWLYTGEVVGTVAGD
ncbi:MAG TPA: isochorismatase family cysteine hydrolase [Caldilineaceae bacterium]|nr:isochorismatase family cysteine hydrolase [Caldilineaceae bacterium]